MPLTIQLPGPLVAFAGGRGRVDLETSAATVGEALVLLWGRYPALRARVLNEQGRVRPHVNIFVGAESIRYTGDLATPLTDGAEITILPAVSGGCAEVGHALGGRTRPS